MTEKKNKTSGAYYPMEEEIDLGQILEDILHRWKLVLSVIVLGTLAAAGYAFSQPAVYQVTAEISIPPASNAERLNVVLSTDRTRADSLNTSNSNLFDFYLSTLEARNNLRAFAEEQLAEVSPVERNRLRVQIQRLNANAIVSLNHTNEALAVAMVNGYLNYAEQIARENFGRELEQLKQLRLEELQSDLRLREELHAMQSDGNELPDLGEAPIVVVLSEDQMVSSIHKGWPSAEAEIQLDILRLEALGTDLSETSFYQLTGSAVEIGQVVAPDRRMYVALGAAVSTALALILALLMGTLARRRQK